MLFFRQKDFHILGRGKRTLSGGRKQAGMGRATYIMYISMIINEKTRKKAGFFIVFSEVPSGFEPLWKLLQSSA